MRAMQVANRVQAPTSTQAPREFSHSQIAPTVTDSVDIDGDDVDNTVQTFATNIALSCCCCLWHRCHSNAR